MNVLAHDPSETKKVTNFGSDDLARVDALLQTSIPRLQSLQKDEILTIADLYLKRVNQQAASIGITIELSEEVKNLLVNKG